jgi:hypothetical protein
MTKAELIRHMLAEHDPRLYYTSADTKAALDSAHRDYHARLGADHEHDGDSEGN